MALYILLLLGTEHSRSQARQPHTAPGHKCHHPNLQATQYLSYCRVSVDGYPDGTYRIELGQRCPFGGYHRRTRYFFIVIIVVAFVGLCVCVFVTICDVLVVVVIVIVIVIAIFIVIAIVII